MKNTRTKIFHRWVKLMAELMVAESQSRHLAQAQVNPKTHLEQPCCPTTGPGAGTGGQLQGTMNG